MTKINSLIVPVAYQGGKTRLAAQIVDHWWPTDRLFYDICCGSGAIIEMLNRGANVDDIVMVDAGPWGLFWEDIGDGTFDLAAFTHYVAEMPDDPRMIQGYVKELFRQPANIDTTAVFLIMQATTFGGAALWIEDGHWKKAAGWRNYWEPTATSNRRSHVNPMMPMPKTLAQRVWAVMQRMHGITAYCADAATIDIENDSLAYIDPPYLGTTAYGHTLDAEALFRHVGLSSVCYLSEGRRVGDEGILLHVGRAKGGMSGGRKVTANQEWLSIKRPA